MDRIDSLLAIAAFAGTLGLIAAAGGGVDAGAVVLAALASLPLAARRRAPLPVFVITALASTALAAVATPEGPPIGPTLALFFAADAGTPAPVTLATATVLLVAHATAGGLARDAFPGPELLFGIAVWGGAWLAGDRARLRRQRIAELEDRAARAEREAEQERRLAAAEERSRIARDLHDSAGHAINVILVHAGLGRLRSARDELDVRTEFETIEQVARETIGEIDQLVGALRAEPRDDVEPPPGLAALPRLVERHRAAGLDVTATVHGERPPLPRAVDRAAYRILQEALTNAARHGSGTARVEVAFDDGVELTVTNPLGGDGRGTSGGHGVVGMRERATLLGGTLDAGARDGRFEVTARLP
jgi:signal transduction histidine kinase